MDKIIVTVLLLLAPGTALAYFDAGTGALLMQGLVGAVTFMVVFWGRVKLYIRSLFYKDAAVSSEIDGGADRVSDEQAGAGAGAKQRP